MSLALIHSRAQLGINALAVQVEVHLSAGLPSLAIVGLPETAVKESKERVRSALINSGFSFPQRRITINLAPADLPKEGGRYDLAIAIGILIATEQVPNTNINQYEFVAELSLAGNLRPVSGILPAAIACKNEHRNLVLAPANAQEATLVKQLKLYNPTNLLELVAHLREVKSLTPYQNNQALNSHIQYPDLQDIKGQAQAKRLLEIGAAGRHNILLIGPPGSGKSMLAQRLPGLLPPMTEQQSLEVATIHSVQGSKYIQGQRPVRHPHHTASAVALVGGGTNPKPGEISLAHQGVLFLDELPEFSRQVLEVLREPLEAGEILISRAKQQCWFPAQFQLITALNPCPCGYFNDGTERCHCSPDRIRNYQHKLSGPLLDRIDMQLWVNAPSKEELLLDRTQTESSAEVQKRVITAYNIQLQRQGCANQELVGEDLEQHCNLITEDKLQLLDALDKLHLSARAYQRIIRVARTIADLEKKDQITNQHLFEALSYRRGLLSNLT